MIYKYLLLLMLVLAVFVKDTIAADDESLTTTSELSTEAMTDHDGDQDGSDRSARFLQHGCGGYYNNYCHCPFGQKVSYYYDYNGCRRCRCVPYNPPFNRCFWIRCPPGYFCQYGRCRRYTYYANNAAGSNANNADNTDNGATNTDNNQQGSQ